MKLSLGIVLALATSIGLPARAAAEPPPDPATPLLEVYGTLVPFVESTRTTAPSAPGPTQATQVAMATGLAAPARFRLDMGTSNLGFRGGVPLSDELAVVWQIESQVQADGTPVANTVASRNSQIGMTGHWGTLFAGQWDTPYKWATLPVVNPIRAGFLPDYTGLLSGPGFAVGTVVTQAGRVGNPSDAAFYRRQGNSVQYWTPTVAGLSARVAYGLDEGRTATTAMAPSINPTILSTLVSYDHGPLKLRYGFELHHDYFGLAFQGGSPGASLTNRSSNDQGHVLVASYSHRTPGFDTRVVGVFEYLRYTTKDAMPGAVNEHDRAAYYGLIDQTLLGKHHVWAAFGQAFAGSCGVVGGAACSTTGLGASMGVLGYVYRFSKTTDVFAAAYRITNDSAASYSTFPPLAGPVATGADLEGLGIGMVYEFSATIASAHHPALALPSSPPAAPVPAPAPVPVTAPAPEPAPVPVTTPSPEPAPVP